MSQETKTIRPSYYQTDSPYEPIKIIRHYNLEFERANSLKYILRAGVKNKDTEQEDLIKAITYLQLRVDYLESLKNQNYKKGGEVMQPLKVWNRDKLNPISEKEKKQWHDDVSPKLISELHEGDMIMAIKNLCQEFIDEEYLTSRNVYIINKFEYGCVEILDNNDKLRSFKLDTLHEFFHVSKE